MGSAFGRLDRELHELERAMDRLRRPHADRGARPAGSDRAGGVQAELQRLAAELERLARELSVAAGQAPAPATEDRRGSPGRPVPGEAREP